MIGANNVASLSEDSGNETNSKREFIFTERDFRFVQRLLRERSGIVVSDSKQNMVYGRLARRLRVLGFSSFKEYCGYLAENEAEELQVFLNSLTTNLTSFFRERHHFEYLKSTLVPELIKNKRERTIRVWSAGCSTGEEPYSIAITLEELLPAAWDIKILATDLDSDVLQKAESGIYPLEKLESIPQGYLKRYFRRGSGANEGMARVCGEIRSMISFRQLNLMNDWPMRRPFDVIFCRNVIIYFDKGIQSILVNRYADQLVDNGRLFLGHSETLYNVCDRFSSLGQTIYMKSR